MRLFLAIEIAPELRANLEAIQERLKTADADVRWSRSEQFHLTVVFLGDVADSLLEPIQEVCADVANRTAPFRVALRGGSAFPRRGPLKTLWVGLREGTEEWKALAQRAEEPLRPFGVARSTDLVPHITLGRVRSDRNGEQLRVALNREAQTECGEQPAHRLSLVQSLLNPDGAIYHTVGTWDFNDNKSLD